MNKNILKAITYTAFATTIAACTSGSSSNNSSVPQAPFTATYLAPPIGATATTGSGYYSKLEGNNTYIIYAPNGGESYVKDSVTLQSKPIYISTYAYENLINQTYPYIQYTTESTPGVIAYFDSTESHSNNITGFFSSSNESNSFVKLQINNTPALYTTESNNILYNNTLNSESTITSPCGEHGGITSFTGAELPQSQNRDGILGLGYSDGYFCIFELQYKTELYNVYATAESQGYKSSSPVTGVTFGQDPASRNGYGYWISSGNIFAFETPLDNTTCESNCIFTNLSNLPYAPSNPISIVADILTNYVYVGTKNGMVYVLENSSNNPSWGAIQLTKNGANDNSAVNSLARATKGIVATTVAGNVYSINPK